MQKLWYYNRFVCIRCASLGSFYIFFNVFSHSIMTETETTTPFSVNGKPFTLEYDFWWDCSARLSIIPSIWILQSIVRLNQLAIDCQFKCKEHFASMMIDQWLKYNSQNASVYGSASSFCVVYHLTSDFILVGCVFYDATFSLYVYDKEWAKDFTWNSMKFQ